MHCFSGKGGAEFPKRMHYRNGILNLIPDTDKSPLDKVLEKERNARLRKAMKVLTQRQRKVVIYYYMKNKSIKEISRILKISYRTVINTKTTALKKLRKQMEN